MVFLPSFLCHVLSCRWWNWYLAVPRLLWTTKTRCIISTYWHSTDWPPRWGMKWNTSWKVRTPYLTVTTSLGNSDVRALNQIPWTIAGLNELVPENLLAIFDENELEVCVMFIMKVCCRLKRHLGILWVFFSPLLTFSAVDVRHRWYKRAGFQGPCSDCWRIVALQGESKSQDSFFALPFL